MKRPSKASTERLAVGYVRVSTGRQVAEGVSLDMQRARIAAWSQAHGYRLLTIHEDAGVSGKAVRNRPGFRAALEEACNEGAALVVFSLSRASRSMRDLLDVSERLEASGADLVSLSESIDSTGPAGRLVFRILAAIAEFERELIGQRVSECMRHASASGRHMGRAPRGLHFVDKRLEVVDEVALRVYRRACKLRKQGQTFAAIAATLAAEGFKPARAPRFSPKVVRDMIRSRALATAAA